jgi:hypothetical protein
MRPSTTITRCAWPADSAAAYVLMRRPTRFLSSTVENANTTWPESNHDGEAGIISHPGAQGNGTGVGCGEDKANKPMPYVTTMRFTFRIRVGTHHVQNQRPILRFQPG